MIRLRGERAEGEDERGLLALGTLRDGAVGRGLAAAAPLLIMLVGTRVVWRDVPWGVTLGGAELGLLSAMIAVGLSLTYRANRIINFAQADLGIAPSLLALLLILAKGWSVWLALPLGLLAAGVLGALVELVFVRRFFAAPRLILTVAPIGIAQILVAVSLFMPGWFGDLANSRPPAFVNVSFTLGQVAFDGHDLAVFVIVPLVFLALAVFMRSSAIGVGLRGSAESANRALLLGVPVKRLHTVVWVISSLLAFTGLFLRAGVVGVSIGRVLGPEVLLPALGAAVIGRMERMPTIVGAAVGLGIVGQSVRFAWNQDAYRDVVIAGIIVAALLFVRARGPHRVVDTESSSWQATRETRPIPAELRRVKEVRIAQWVLAALALAGLAAIPVYLGQSRVLLAGTIGIFAIIGVSLVVLTGWAGQVSLGQVAVVGLAGAAAGSVTTRYHWDLSLALLVGGVVGALVMTAVGLPTLRARGLTFAVTTLALALITSSYLLNPAFFSWWLPEGRIERTRIFGTISVESETRYYVLILVMLAFALVAARGLRTTRTGRVLIGTRENERAAQAFGIDARRSVVIAFAFSGFISGVAGALFVHQQRAVDLLNFAPEAGLRVFSMVVVGGLGSMSGALAGAIYVSGIDWFLPPEWSFLATGAGMLLVLMLLPGGLGGAIGDVRDNTLRWFARRRGIRVPSLVADTLVPEVDRGNPTPPPHPVPEDEPAMAEPAP
ncbi:MAG: branched-chain amino acid transport system permease protein livM [Actinomycetota bacterium]|nr:branched-chain amino acid transport system permease protein livM [Actinomycetota bacterium]